MFVSVYLYLFPQVHAVLSGNPIFRPRGRVPKIHEREEIVVVGVPIRVRVLDDRIVEELVIQRLRITTTTHEGPRETAFEEMLE